MTLEEVREYAEEKRCGRKFIDSYIREIELDENGNVKYPCFVRPYIDKVAQDHETMRRIIKRNREEREKRKERTKAKDGE